MTWLEVLMSQSVEVQTFVKQRGDREPLNYQIKWNILRSVFSRRPSGTLRHLPSKTSMDF